MAISLGILTQHFQTNPVGYNSSSVDSRVDVFPPAGWQPPFLATGETQPAWWYLQVTSTASSFGHLSRDRGKCQTDLLQERFGMLRFDENSFMICIQQSWD